MNMNFIKNVAKRAHAGQKDLGGEDYFKHLETVANAVRKYGEEYEMVAWLHDILEDTNITEKDLLDFGIPKEIIDAVKAMTKIPNEDYKNYIQRIKNNELARIVKIHDMEHNSDLSRLKSVSSKDIARKEKYKKHINFLKDVEISEQLKDILNKIENNILYEDIDNIHEKIEKLNIRDKNIFLDILEDIIETTKPSW